ncbi:MAG: sigma 54-interacting transcriptional regulator [Desulfobacteraceae bacterium]|nr:sigma 54-interacting transcriptional regulator [Desulfobacteraceae bacterium]
MAPKSPEDESALSEPDADILYRFVDLLAELWPDLIGPDDGDGNLERAMRRIVEFLDVDRMSIIELSLDGSELVITRSYAREGTFLPPDIIHESQFPWLTRQIRAARLVQIKSLEDIPAEAVEERAFARAEGLVANVTIPLLAGDTVLGAVGVGWHRTPHHWSDAMLKRFRLIGRAFANLLVRRRMETSLRGAYEEIRHLQQQMATDCAFLQEEIKTEHNFDDIIGKSAAIRNSLRKVGKVGPYDTTVLILGETGTGKELFARAVHDSSSRRDRPLLKVNCAALPPSLIESELFGHIRGAFTGAIENRVGRFEAADGGTVFLDEIGELPLEMQAKLLRVLQYGELEKLGSSETTQVDVRIIAATNRNLEEEIQQGRFRKDLYYRLRVFPIDIPPLRERAEDVPLLLKAFLVRISRKLGKPVPKVAKSTVELLKAYAWPGNVRELESVVEYGVIVSEGSMLTVELPRASAVVADKSRTLAEMERHHILETLRETGWKIAGPGGAAERLALHPNTLRSRIRKLAIRRPD